MPQEKMPSIEMFVDSEGKTRFRVKARNGEILCQSEAYANNRNCLKGIDALADVMWQYESERIEIKRVIL